MEEGGDKRREGREGEEEEEARVVVVKMFIRLISDAETTCDGGREREEGEQIIAGNKDGRS